MKIKEWREQIHMAAWYDSQMAHRRFAGLSGNAADLCQNLCYVDKDSDYRGYEGLPWTSRCRIWLVDARDRVLVRTRLDGIYFTLSNINDWFDHWTSSLHCKWRGHDIEDCSSAGPDSGNMDHECRRCSQYWSVPLY